MLKKQYRYISGDSHLEIDTKHWVGRVPAQWRDQAPRLVRQPDGSDAWAVNNKIARAAAAADLYGGKGREQYVPFGAKYEGTPGTGSPEQRLREQDQDGIDAEVLFPSQQGGPKLWRRIEDDDAYRSVVRAYNGWLAEEYCAAEPSRLVGVGILPLTHDVQDTIDEIEYCAKAGLKTVLLQGFPSGRPYPSEDDDRFWSAAIDLHMPVSVHVDLDRSGERAGPLLRFPREPEDIMDKLVPGLVDQVSRFGPVRGNGAIAAVQWVLSGLFDRFPTLKILFAENQIGWIPFFLQGADVRYDRHYHWAQRLLGFEPLRCPPSEIIREHYFWGFQFDRVGVELRHKVNVDRLIWGSDFPHQESDWPDSLGVIERNFAGVPEDEKYKMVCGNAVEFFRLTQG
ncbi:MAG TPA: amidohydrolase family protein [Candidatus Binatia bacterium]|jgi:predicted TIM-barrel fold metal-dependent hydrolase